MREMSGNEIRLIAFYLPQYHPIPENDEWWGKGFTEWFNVVKGKPLFPGHYQPRLPADLGFYDLRLPESRIAQAELASAYGIYGFCYYHYWFKGRRLLERPVAEVVKSREPDFPFCLCWANENWTKAWDGGENHLLMSQQYSHEDDNDHISYLLTIFDDYRYIRVDGKPLFIVYRPESLPSPSNTLECWRQAALSSGIGELYLACIEDYSTTFNPIDNGFDAVIEFAPDWRNMGRRKFRGVGGRLLSLAGIVNKALLNQAVILYDDLVCEMMQKKIPLDPFFRCVCPSFDNSARRKSGAAIFYDSTPTKYGQWLSEVIEWTKNNHNYEKRIVFINAWNEWGEGNYLEPDQLWGREYLEKTYQALITGT
jgi:lipopolysaccharide biosynthesis protein